MNDNAIDKHPKDMTSKDIANEMKFCVDVGQLLFNTVIKETGGHGPRVILSTAVLLVALCDENDEVLASILEGYSVLTDQVDKAKKAIMSEAKKSPIN